jgi:SAM-dependent methyltransferase
MLRGVSEIREAYRDEGVAATYIEQRFHQPLGALLHARQASALKRLVRLRGLTSLLEVAPGPARLTVELAAHPDTHGIVVDASFQMLAEARRRLVSIAGARWRCLQGDAFALPVQGIFDLAYTFRLIRHFEAADRARIYTQLARVVRPGGYLMFDAVNEVVSAPLRAQAKPGEYQHFDALLTPALLDAELEPHGFVVESLTGVQHAPRAATLARAAMEAIDRVQVGEPLEWIVTCRRV